MDESFVTSSESMVFSSSRGAPRGSFFQLAGFESGQNARESITHTKGELPTAS
jgi:hypothetical protein